METGIGKRIRARRKELGLSQEELANRMGLKSKSTICKIERGEDNLTTPIVKRYAQALDCSVAYLMDIKVVGPNEFIKEMPGHTEPLHIYAPKAPEYSFEDDLDEESKEFAHLFQDASEEERALVMAYLKKKQPKP